MGRQGRKPVVVIGGGRVGQAAVDLLRGLGFGRLTVVDSDPAALSGLGPGVKTVPDQGPDWLARNFDGTGWIIPAAPIHLAYEWLRLRLNGRVEPIETPLEPFESLPNLARAQGGGLTFSRADFICPDGCSEHGPCPVVGGRPEPLYHVLRNLAGAPPLAVVRSQPLAPGLGGYPARWLERLTAEVMARRGPVYVATVCRCHGVIHGLTRPRGDDR